MRIEEPEDYATVVIPGFLPSLATPIHKRPNMNRLNGKRALITGGNSGIGRASAKAYAQEGAKVFLFGRDEETLRSASKEIGEPSVGTVSGDVTRMEDLDKLFESAASAMGKIDVLHVNAGIGKSAPLAETTPELFDQVTNINQKGAFFTIQKALPHLSDGASVIITGSSVNELGMPGMSAYSMTKAAVRNLARTLTAELKDRDIRVNVLQPGPIDTSFFERLDIEEEKKKEMSENIENQVPAGRFGQADEIAQAALFLASDESKYMRGAVMTIDGGMVAI